MRYNEIGINEDTINKLILDIYDYAEKISQTLDQVTNEVTLTKSFYKSSAASAYRNDFNNFKTNFSIINKNIISYAEDLTKLKNRYKRIDQNMSATIKKTTNNIEVGQKKKWW